MYNISNQRFSSLYCAEYPGITVRYPRNPQIAYKLLYDPLKRELGIGGYFLMAILRKLFKAIFMEIFPKVKQGMIIPKL
jgi:hypothetical protein